MTFLLHRSNILLVLLSLPRRSVFHLSWKNYNSSDIRAVHANYHPLQEGPGSSGWRQSGRRTRGRCNRYARSSQCSQSQTLHYGMEYGPRMGRGDIMRSRVGCLDSPKQNYALQPDRRHDRVAVGCLRGLRSLLEREREREKGRRSRCCDSLRYHFNLIKLIQ